MLLEKTHEKIETNKETGNKNMPFASCLIKECLRTQET